jgi:hypothetical protein
MKKLMNLLRIELHTLAKALRNAFLYAIRYLATILR